MIAFVGSQLAEEGAFTTSVAILMACAGTTRVASMTLLTSDLVKGTDEKDGIWVRLTVQRLWTFSVALEHVIMLLRVFIMKVEPEVPEWVDESRDVMMFRLGQWHKAIKVCVQHG